MTVQKGEPTLKIIARIEILNQIGPDDYRVRPITKVFEDTATVGEIHAWALSHGSGYLVNDIELSQPQR